MNDHFCHFRRLVQSFDGSVVLRPQQAEPRPHLFLHVLLADNDEGYGEYSNTHNGTYWFANKNTHTGANTDLAHKDEEHEEAAKEIETVDHPEEHLQVGGVVTQPALHFCVCNIIDLLCCPICICVTTRLDGWRAECSGLLRTSTRFQGSGTAWCRAPCILQ